MLTGGLPLRCFLQGFGEAALGLVRGQRPRRQCYSRYNRIFHASCLGAIVNFLFWPIHQAPSPAIGPPAAAVSPEAPRRKQPHRTTPPSRPQIVGACPTQRQLYSRLEPPRPFPAPGPHP